MFNLLQETFSLQILQIMVADFGVKTLIKNPSKYEITNFKRHKQ